VAGSRRAVLGVLMVIAVSGLACARQHSGDAMPDSSAPAHLRRVRLLALGDINLGRRLGKRLLAGDTLMPFERVRDSLKAYDVVFANLESNISDQHGRTESRTSNTVFTAPPVAARVLKQGGVTVVSTANNHALDFGPDAQRQSLRFLDSAGIAHCGTSFARESLFVPASLTVNGIRLAFFAVTGIMNGTGSSWKRYVAPADTALLFPAMRRARAAADYVVVSYHGGDEYADEPAEESRVFIDAALSAGADLVVGHHPHVPYGTIEIGGRLGAYSLGNFIFKQPSRYWTQHGLALSVEITADSTGAHAASWRLMPVNVDYQPSLSTAPEEIDAAARRVGTLSSVAPRKQE
jgi:poly-gamma-glutamate capsule biosynthesis protein CapA/YwtB (metallophosphatase superfamily)